MSKFAFHLVLLIVSVTLLNQCLGLIRYAFEDGGYLQQTLVVVCLCFASVCAYQSTLVLVRRF